MRLRDEETLLPLREAQRVRLLNKKTGEVLDGYIVATYSNGYDVLIAPADGSLHPHARPEIKRVRL